jgi:hypothetical protein
MLRWSIVEGACGRIQPMDIHDEWRVFDLDDARTHPLALNDVEIEFENGRTEIGYFSGNLSIFTYCAGEPLENTKPTRWRYTDAIRCPLCESD